MLVWCMLVVKLFDELKEQHAQVIVRYALLIFKWYQSLAYNVDLMRYLVFVFCKSYLTKMVLRMVYLVHSDWYHVLKFHLLYLIIIWQTLLSHNSNLCICPSFQSKLLAHMQGEQMLPMKVHETCPNPLHMVNMLGQATWIQMNFNSYLCERVVINYQKGED